MKLNDAVVMARFCGLETLEEAIVNIELHYWSMLPPSEIKEAKRTFYEEVKAYEAGKLKLDEAYIKKELKRLETVLNNSTELTEEYKIH